MKFVEYSGLTTPQLNLALEEYLLRQEAGEFFLVYVNDPSVIIGRNQVVWAEVDVDYVQAHALQVVRRKSGGGAVYHDHHNLNFSFIVNGREGISDYGRFTEPISRALKQFGVETTLNKSGALFVGERKISGHAQYATGNRLLSHGTLLFAAEMTHLRQSLKPPFNVTQSSGVKSVRSSVVNLVELLPDGTTIEDLKMAILQEVDVVSETYQPTATVWEEVKTLAQNYEEWTWNYGRSPKCVIENSKQFAAGEVDVRIEIEKGVIASIDFYCSFFDKEEPNELVEKLQGIPFKRDELLACVQDADLHLYFGDVDQAAFLQLLYC